MDNITLNAYAKINLILDLPCILPNGYHSIYTVMQSVGMYDRVYVKKSADGVSLSCSDASVPTDASNTACKAIRSFEKHTGLCCKVDVRIEKNIPSQAGLGGGSSDAAAVIRALDILYKTKLADAAMREIGLFAGADVPFFITGGTALCQNIGEVISILPDLPSTNIIVVKPASSVSTQLAYAQFDSLHSVRRPKKEEFLFHAQNADLKAMSERVANVFEQAVDVSCRADIKSIMRKHRALCSCMSGSGSAIFGIFDDEIAARECAQALKKKYSDVFHCKNTTCGSEIIKQAE